MIEVTENCCCCVLLYLDIGGPQPGQERGGGVGTVRRTAELGRVQSFFQHQPSTELKYKVKNIKKKKFFFWQIGWKSECWYVNVNIDETN